MAINVRCPNEACGKMLSVRDDFAGKTGKCPNCGATMPIPEATATAASADAPEETPARRADIDEIPVRLLSPRKRRDRDYQDDYDEPGAEDYDDDYPTVRKPRKRGSVAGTIVCLGIAIVLLLSLGLLTPLLSLYSISFPNMPFGGFAALPIGGMIGLTEGKILMIGSLLAAALCAAALVVFLTAPVRVGDGFVTASSCFGGGWALAALFWVLGFIWDIKNMSSFRQTLPGSEVTGMDPGLGLWFGLGFSIATVAVFSALASVRGRTAWLYLGEGLGLIAGVLLLTLNVQPWVTGAPMSSQNPAFRDTKMFKRYGVLQPGMNMPAMGFELPLR